MGALKDDEKVAEARSRIMFAIMLHGLDER